MLLLYDGALPTCEIYSKWEQLAKSMNAGALSIFTGIVRKEYDNKKRDITALSFDIYEPLLRKWFEKWQIQARERYEAHLCMAHSQNHIPCAESSFMCGIIASHRHSVLSLYADFIEDFKANAPIWKYDVINGDRIYAKVRSKPLPGSGLLAHNHIK